MAPHLNVSAGPDASSLSTLYVNSDLNPTLVSSAHFHGRIAVRIKHFTGDVPEGKERVAEAKYFEEGHGKGMTWSIQVQGRFLKDISTDDLVFGNEFDRPIKDRLPWGTAVALEAAKFIDPNLEHDLYSDKPWAFSPFVATMTRISAVKLSSEPSSSGSDVQEEFRTTAWPVFPSPENSNASDPAYVLDDLSPLIPYPTSSDAAKDVDIDDATLNDLKGGTGPDSAPQAHKTRARWFGDRAHRQSIKVTPEHVLTADFCNSFIDFNTLRLELPYTGGMGFDLKKYWDGQPVRYVCKDKSDGTVFFFIQFKIVDMDA
ncbi:DUF1769-domain-containing protein [Tilletiaria anomala UBC 951]|uniref:DUF1769-domain-containing protein n=1 Tax=Tilletiaria anomala (strain ATCC 24038 / CBS 436.72 / UBC 951) TaxID=1037660 RepID=A0A066VN24_TILAU|nr:DUF1769-domain-containing protein [Tilletiaria anomala UBC 951]KDN41693.1 DUF1769-domain-containing protein [Tilletiaria anomala UBC 951]